MTSPSLACDVLIAGSGASGLTAAITAHDAGLKVLIAEKEPVFGGSTAYSAGVVWIPCNDQAVAAGIADSADQALRYLSSEVGDKLDVPKARTFVTRAATIRELAEKLGIDADGLAETVDNFNRGAVDGKDPQFDRGSDAYQRFNGSPNQQPNPCVAPVQHGPFYAVRIVPGDIGTFLGLRTDPLARVLNDTSQVIAGLYAVGNDQTSVMGGTYPGAGITLGPAMTFGYLAARHAAGLERCSCPGLYQSMILC